jgi:adenylylsulfate kinase
VDSNARRTFAVWITGLPASGKSTLAAALQHELATRGVDAAVLESDVLRSVFMPQSSYDELDRDAFYRQVAFIGSLLTSHGVPVIFDATANRRRYRDHARSRIPRFVEVYVETPLATCMQRDPKGIYRQAHEGTATNVPGLQAPYEPPHSPDVIVDGEHEIAEHAAKRVTRMLEDRGLLARSVAGA